MQYLQRSIIFPSNCTTIDDHIQFSLKPEQLAIHISDTMVKSCNTLAELKEQILAAGDKLVVIDFFAEWCPPCRMMSPEIERLATEERDVVFLGVDVDTEAGFYTFHLIKEGAKIHEVRFWQVGESTIDKLKEAINEHK